MPSLFNKSNDESSRERALRKDELVQLIDTTLEYMNTHNAVVTRLWEIKHQIEEYNQKLNSKLDINKDERSTLEQRIKTLNNKAVQFHEALNNNHSAEIIDGNLKIIEQLYNNLYPDAKIDFNNSPVNLENLRRNLR